MVSSEELAQQLTDGRSAVRELPRNDWHAHMLRQCPTRHWMDSPLRSRPSITMSETRIGDKNFDCQT